MKKMITLFVVVVMATTASFAHVKPGSMHPHQQKSRTAVKYTCSMHPEIVRNKPGKCPKCEMALVPMKKKMVKGKKAMDKMSM